MALVFPLSVAGFLDELPVQSVSFQCPELVEMSQTAGGDLITGNIGNRLWQGEIMLGRLTRAETQDAQVLIDAVRGACRSFMAYHTTYPYPKADPSGSLLGVASPQIKALDADTRLISLKGLPAGYVLGRGDYLSFDYRTSPTRFALHRIVDASVIANGFGETALFEVIPNIRSGASANTAVSLAKPHCKALIVPGAVQPGRQTRFMTDGMSFQFQQTLR